MLFRSLRGRAPPQHEAVISLLTAHAFSPPCALRPGGLCFTRWRPFHPAGKGGLKASRYCRQASGFPARPAQPDPARTPDAPSHEASAFCEWISCARLRPGKSSMGRKTHLRFASCCPSDLRFASHGQTLHRLQSAQPQIPGRTGQAPYGLICPATSKTGAN